MVGMRQARNDEPLLLTHGELWTPGPDGATLPCRDADSVLVVDKRIAWVGMAQDAPKVGRRIDVGGRAILPGLTDAHCHLFLLALSRVGLQTSHARSIGQLLDIVSDAAARTPQGGWIVSYDYSDMLLAEKRHVTRKELDRVAGDRPVLLRRVGGHLAVANSAAFAAAGVDESVLDPASGGFDRADGRLTGVMREEAEYSVVAVAPLPETDMVHEAMLDVANAYLSLGVTAVVEAAVGFTAGFDAEWKVWTGLREAGRFPLRVGFMPNISATEAELRGLDPGKVDPDWQCVSLKWFADGIVGARTAFVSSSYQDGSGRGQLMMPRDELEQQLTEAHAMGWQVATHAIGDEAVRIVVDILTRAQERYPRADARHRIEHLGVLNRSLLPALAGGGFVVVPQYGFLSRIGDSLFDALGEERMADIYPAKSLIDLGIPVAGSSDCPMGPFSPFEGVAGAMARRSSAGLSISPDERIALEQAVDCYVRGGAKAMYHEKFRGALVAGMAADIAVLDRPLEGLSASELPAVRAEMTLVDGAIRHDTGVLIPAR